MSNNYSIILKSALLVGVSVLIGYGVFNGGQITERNTVPPARADAPLSASAPVVVASTTPTPLTPELSTTTTGTKSSNHSPIRVPILVYHGIRDTLPTDSASVRQFNLAPSMFKKQLAYLASHGFTPITFDDLATYFDQGTVLPQKPVILSFDDGWHSQIESALPELNAAHMVATFYLYPNVIGHEHYMTWEDAQSLVTAGMKIGAHSKSHQYMTKQELGKLDMEIAGSKKILEDHLRVHITSFAYPFGLSDDHIRTMVKDAGYTTARSLEHGTMQDIEHRYILPSYLVRNDLSDFAYFVEKL